MPGKLLNVADIRLRSRVNGPGTRSVVWVQGCTVGCPGCFNPHTHAHKPARLIDAKRLGLRLANVPDTDGTTISGGEPFEQAEACAELAATVQTSGRSVMVFTGYPFEYLQECTSPCVRRFVHSIDLLVAGPYIEHLQCDGTVWRASANQTVHALTDRLKDVLQKASPAAPVVELALHGTHVASTGFPTGEDRRWLEAILSQVGRGDSLIANAEITS